MEATHAKRLNLEFLREKLRAEKAVVETTET
jgi:hypothetical protein